MKTLAALLAAALLAAAPARAEDPHAAHAMETPQQDTHAGHGAGEQAADPHAGHAPGEPPADPHATPEPEERTRDPHAGHGVRQEEPPPEAPPPPAAYAGPRHAADVLFDPADMARARHVLHLEHGAMSTRGVWVDRLETPLESGRDGYAWDAQGWYGGDLNKLWIKTEGKGRFGGRAEEVELQALWSRAVTPWFDAQAGVRYDFRPEPARAYLVLGLQGVMPYLFQVDAAAFVSEEGDVSARLEAEYELLITQRLILQPRAQVELSAQDVPELGVGSGVSDLELGLRLRYEVIRELAPYLGLEWERAFGETADFARAEGADTNDVFIVAGVNFRF